MQKIRKNHLLEGSVLKSILMISVPIILANSLQTVYQLIDTFWVGRLGAKAVAAVSLSFPILFFLNSIVMGITVACSILIAQYNGRGDKGNVSLVLGQSLSLISIMAVGISVVGYFSSNFLLSFLTKDADVLAGATSYLQISFIALLAVIIYMVFQSALRGIGQVKLPMIIISGAVILNFFLDPIFMFGWKFVPAMGVSGVALATLITECLSAIIGIIILLSGRLGIRLELKSLILRIEWIKKLFAMGIPSSIEMSARSFGMVIMTFIVSMFGTLTIAAYGIGTRILMFVIIPAVGFSMGTSALVGNNLGAKQNERAESIIKAGMKIGFFTLTFIGILLFIFAQHISVFFVPGDAALIEKSTLFIKIMSLTFGFIGMQMAIIGAIRASGRTVMSMILAITHTIALLVISYIFAVHFKLDDLGIWIAHPIANFVAFILAFYFYTKKIWLKKELV